MIRALRNPSGPAWRVLTTAAVLTCLFALCIPAALAQELPSPRLRIGINLLPAVIAANKAVINSDPDTVLTIYLAYTANRHLAEQLQTRLAQRGAIHARQLEIVAVRLDELLTREIPRTSSIFIVEPLDERLLGLIEFARQQRALLFSPFEGDVERGVNAGFQVTDRVLPQVNMASLKQSKIQLKAFFLRIAVKHE